MSFETTLNTALADATEAAKVAAAVTGNPVAGLVAEGLSEAGTVSTAVENAAPHSTAVAAIGAGVVALAATPIVQANPQAAALASVSVSFFAWLKSEYAKL